MPWVSFACKSFPFRPKHAAVALVFTAAWTCATAVPVLSQEPPTVSAALPKPAEQAPRWIWGDIPAEAYAFSKSWVIEGSIVSARLKFAADYCYATCTINGKPVLQVAPYCPMQSMDVTSWLQRGENQIVIEAASELFGSDAVAATLLIEQSQGPPFLLQTNDSWQAVPVNMENDAARGPATSTAEANNRALDRGLVAPELWGAGRQGIDVDAFENYEQWQQAKADSPHRKPPAFWTVPGFEVTELRQADPNEGSWIAMAFDPQGRLVISREDRGLLRMTLDASQSTVTRVESIPVDLLECRGLLFHDGWLYANANNSKGVYRLKLSEEGQPQELTLLREFSGGVGHGRNDLGLFQSPDGAYLYSIHGDSVDVPGAPMVDRTSPINESRTLPPKGEGQLVRLHLESGQWELMAAGLRNPYGIAIHADGAPFTYDADNEHDTGTPWYRATRVLHLMTGGDTGYRNASGVLPPRFHDQPDQAPPLLEIGRGSPTAAMFGYELSFPAPYKQALYVLDWTYGRVVAVHLAKRGASWRTGTELFLQGRPLNVTDVAAGPDGAMYLITGGRATQSALYRVRYVGPDSEDGTAAAAASPHEAASLLYSTAVKDALVELGLSEQPTTAEESARLHPGSPWELPLAEDDPVVRHTARIWLERQPAAQWVTHALAVDVEGKWQYPKFWPARSRIAGERARQLFALLAVARTRKPEHSAALLDRLLEVPLAQADLTSQFVWVRICDLVRETSPEAMAAAKEPVLAKLTELWPQLDRISTLADTASDLPGTPAATEPRPKRVSPEGTQVELRRNVAMLLSALQYPDLPRLIAPDLFDSPLQEDQLTGLLALANAATGWTPELRQRQFQVLNDIPRMVGGEGLPQFASWVRPQMVATLTPQEQTALGSLLQPSAAEIVEPLPPPRPFVKKWSLEDLTHVTEGGSPPGDVARGKEIFAKALCTRCHRVGIRGAVVGPELTQVGRRFSRRDILQSVLLPSLSVAEQYRLLAIETSTGQVHVGRVVPGGDYRKETLVLVTDALRPDQTVTIDKKEITTHQATSKSPMPEGLLDSFTEQEIRDLLSYLESGQAE